MTSGREYGAAIFSPGLGEVLLVRHSEESGWAFPFGHTTESDVHVVAAASAVRQILGVDIGDKISRTHWIEAEFPQTGALVRLYVALGVRPEAAVPRCAAPGAVAQWHPLRSILPPVNAILRADHSTAAANDDAEGGSGSLLLEAGIAPFLAKLKALLNRHPEWRISQLDPHLTRLIQQALALPATNTQHQHHHQQQQQQLHAVKQEPPEEGTVQLGPQVGTQAGDGDPQQEQQGQREQQQGQPEEGGQPGQQAEPQAGGAAQEGEVEAGEAAKGAAEGGEAAGGSAAGEGEQAVPQAAVAAAASDAAGQAAAAAAGCAADGGVGGSEGDGGGGAGGWCGPQPQEHLLEHCRRNDLPEPCYSLVVKKSARRPLVTASCILSHLGVQITPDMHVPGGIHAACQAAALAAILWLEGALPPDGGDAVRVVPVGWPPLLSEARGESWEAAQLARRAGGARRELDTAQKEALLREMDKKRQRLVAEAAELERLMEALRDGGGFPEPDLTRLTASLGLTGGGGDGEGGAPAQEPSAALVAAPASGGGGARGAKRGAAGGDADGGDGSGGLTGLAVGLRALKFRSSDSLGPAGGGPGAPGSGGGGGGGGGRGPGGGGGGRRAPGTKRPRDDGQTGGAQGGEAAGGSGAAGATTPSKNVVMELKELCDRRRWPQPQYAFKAGAGPRAGPAAVLTLPPAAGLGEVDSGPQSNRKRAKEAAAAAALAQLSALGLK
ncbi:hypothetical protein PLESTM_000342000 [Pleodorina starrii]|nr:hypothetical protein PLESTM_000342000 [Pleodorina starrii]